MNPDQMLKNGIYDWDVKKINHALNNGAKLDGGTLALHEAVRDGSPGIVTLLLNKGANIEDADWQGETPIWYAVRDGNLVMVKLLLARGANVNSMDGTGKTLLHIVQHIEIAQEIISRGLSASLKDNSGNTTLISYMLNDFYHDPEMVRLLIKNGADIFASNNYGESALMLALQQSQPRPEDMSDVLYSVPPPALVRPVPPKDRMPPPPPMPLQRAYAGPPPSGPWHSYLPAVSAMFEYVRPSDMAKLEANVPMMFLVNDPEIAKFLVLQGASLNRVNSQGDTATMDSLKKYKYEMANFLLEHEPVTEQKDVMGNTLLSLAMGAGYDFVETVISKGADVNTVNKDGETPLHYANSVALAALLLKNGARFLPDLNGETPLMFALKQHEIGLVNYYLEHVNIDKATLNAALAYSLQNRLNDLSKVFFEKGATMTKADLGSALITAIQQYNIETADLLLEKGAHPSYRDAAFVTPLLAAIRIGNLPLIQKLIDLGAKLDAAAFSAAFQMGNMEIAKTLFLKGNADKDTMGQGLIDSINRGSDTMAQFLLSKGALPNYIGVKGDRPILSALRKYNVVIAKLLFEKGASIGPVELNNALLDSAKNGKDAVVQLLLDKGANVNFIDQTGETALKAALQASHFLIVKLLLERGANASPELLGRVFIEALGKKNVALATLLLDKVPANYAEGKETVLKAAVRAGSLDIVKALLQKGANVGYSPDPETPIDIALSINNVEIIDVLLTKGATLDFNAAMIASAKKNKLKTSALLFRRGADINAQDSNGNTLLHILFTLNNSKNDTKSLIVALIKNGSNPNIVNYDGRKPRDLTTDKELQSALTVKGTRSNNSRNQMVRKGRKSLKALGGSKKRQTRRKQKGGGLSITIDEYTFTLLRKTLGDPLTLGSRDILHLVSSEEFYLYRSESEGMWRFACFDSGNKSLLYKGEDYVTVTFVHIELQKFINENLHLVPDAEIKLESLPLCTSLTLPAQTLTTPNEFKELVKIKCGLQYDHFSSPHQAQEKMLYMKIDDLKALAIEGKNDLLLSIIEKYEPAFTKLRNYKTVHEKYAKLNEEGEEDTNVVFKNNYHVVASDALQSFYGILHSYIQSIMTVKTETFRFLFSFHNDLFTAISYLRKDVKKEKPLREHADILYNLYSVDVVIGSVEYELICAKYRYNYEDEKASVKGSEEYTCVVNLVPKLNSITKYGIYENVLTVGNYVCKIMEYDLNTLLSLGHLNQSRKNISYDKYRSSLPLKIGHYWFVGNHVSGMFPLNTLPFGPIRAPTGL